MEAYRRTQNQGVFRTLQIDIGSTGNNYGGNVLGLMPAFKDTVTGLTPKAGSANGDKDGLDLKRKL
ncbi:hypothetical protein [Acetobacter indonesiensis]